MFKLNGTKMHDISGSCALLAIVEFFVLSISGYTESYSQFVNHILYVVWYTIPALLLGGFFLSIIALSKEQDKVNSGVALVLNLVPLLLLIYLYFF